MLDQDPKDRAHNFIPKAHDCLRRVAGAYEQSTCVRICVVVCMREMGEARYVCQSLYFSLAYGSIRGCSACLLLMLTQHLVVFCSLVLFALALTIE